MSKPILEKIENLNDPITVNKNQLLVTNLSLKIHRIQTGEFYQIFKEWTISTLNYSDYKGRKGRTGDTLQFFLEACITFIEKTDKKIGEKKSTFQSHLLI